jgi:hypothetical protein
MAAKVTPYHSDARRFMISKVVIKLLGSLNYGNRVYGER